MYPLNLDISGKRCVVIGGGGVAARKVRGLLEAGARVCVISPQVTEELRELAERHDLEWLARPYQKGDLAGALLVFAATDAPEVQAEVVQEAARVGQLVNVADDPDSCTFHVPAMVRRGDLLLTVSTSGRSPAAAAMIREQLAREYGLEYQTVIEIMAGIRQQILTMDCSRQEKKMLFRKIFQADIVQWIKAGRWEALRQHFQAVLGADPDLDFSSFRQVP